MTMRVAIGVFAEPPLPGRCRRKLLTAHAAEWAAGLYAAMLRDTLDGLLSIDASEYLVFAEDEEITQTLRRHVPGPWEIVTGVPDASRALLRLGAAEGLAILARSDAPSAPTDPILETLASSGDDPFVVLGPTEEGHAWLLGARGLAERAGSGDALHIVDELPWALPELRHTMRVRCTRIGMTLHELPSATIVEEPSGVLAMFDELRRHPERAPRTAQFVATRA